METPRPTDAKNFCPDIKVNTPNTTIYVNGWSRQRLNPLIAKVGGFVDKTSRQMGDIFCTRFENYQRGVRKREDDKILEFLQSKNMHLPQFTLFDAKYAHEFLEDAGFKDEYIGKDSLLLVFQFPKPVSTFWRKERLRIDRKDQVRPHIRNVVREMLSQNDPSFDTQRLQHILGEYKPDSGLKPIEWGRFMAPLARTIWENILLYSERSKELEFHRVNGKGDHDADMFHYMFEVKFPNNKKGGIRPARRRAARRHRPILNSTTV